MIRLNIRTCIFFLLLLLVQACGQDDTVSIPEKESLSFKVEQNIAVLNGIIDSTTPEKFIEFIELNPQIETLVFDNMPGSMDDDANLVLARTVRRYGLNTHLRSDADIASGATDLFMSGVERTVECGAIFGVHSWKAIVIEDGVQTEYTARDIPRDPEHEDHKMFIDYYEEMGIPTEFYWYTVDTAPFESMSNLDADTLERFEIVTKPIDRSSC